MPRWAVAVVAGTAITVALVRAFESISVEVWFDFIAHLRFREPGGVAFALLWLVVLGVGVGFVAIGGGRYHWLLPGTPAILVFLVLLPRLFGPFLPMWYPHWLTRAAQFGFSEAVHLTVGILAFGALWSYLQTSGNSKPQQDGPRTKFATRSPGAVALGLIAAVTILRALQAVTSDYGFTALARFQPALLWMTLIGAVVGAVAVLGGRVHSLIPGLAAALLMTAFLPLLVSQAIPVWYPNWLNRWIVFALSPAVFVAIGVLALGAVWPHAEGVMTRRRVSTPDVAEHEVPDRT